MKKILFIFISIMFASSMFAHVRKPNIVIKSSIIIEKDTIVIPQYFIQSDDKLYNTFGNLASFQHIRCSVIDTVSFDNYNSDLLPLNYYYGMKPCMCEIYYINNDSVIDKEYLEIRYFEKAFKYMTFQKGINDPKWIDPNTEVITLEKKYICYSTIIDEEPTERICVFQHKYNEIKDKQEYICLFINDPTH